MSNLYFKGDNIFLYAQFLDNAGNPKEAKNPQVRVLYINQGAYEEKLTWKFMQTMGPSEYFYNYQVPYDAGLGQYQVIYKGIVDNKEAVVMETFHVLTKSEVYENAIKIYGNVSDIRTNCALMDTAVTIENTQTGEIVSQTSTNEDGYWEAYVYPGEYKFNFLKEQFTPMDITAQIGDEHLEMQFNNIGLESDKYKQKGNGIYSVGDTYTTKQGTPLVGLEIQIKNVFDPTKLVAIDKTNENGEWECFLDPGTYFLTVKGEKIQGKNFDKKFRLKLDDNAEYDFEDLSKNTAIATDNTYVGPGEMKDGYVKVSDIIADRAGNPIIDVQVNAFKPGSPMNDSDIIAQSYSDPDGKWELYLVPGNYVIEYYHPKFKVITENRTVS